MPKTYINVEQKQISDIQRYVIGTRKMKRISQEQIAKAIGKTRQTYADRENDMSDISLADLLITLHELGLDLEIYERREE